MNTLNPFCRHQQTHVDLIKEEYKIIITNDLMRIVIGNIVELI